MYVDLSDKCLRRGLLRVRSEHASRDQNGLVRGCQFEGRAVERRTHHILAGFTNFRQEAEGFVLLTQVPTVTTAALKLEMFFMFAFQHHN